MPIDTEMDPAVDDQDLLRKAMRQTNAPAPTPSDTSTGGYTANITKSYNYIPDPKPPVLDVNSSPGMSRGFGARLASSADTAPPIPTQAPDMPNPDIFTDKNLQPLDRGMAQQQPPAPPGPQTTLGSLIQQRAEAGKPLDRNDPKYKMGTGGRIAGVLANFASGMAGRGPVKYIGPGATNNKYSQDDSTRQANVSNLDAQIGNTEKLDDSNRKLYDSAVRQANEASLGQSREEVAQARQSSARAQQEVADARTTAAGAQKELADYKSDPDNQRPKTWQDATVRAAIEKDPAKKAQLQALAKQLKQGEIDIHSSEHPRQLNMRDQLRVNAKAKELGKSVSDLTDEEINGAISPNKSAGKDFTKDREQAEARKNSELARLQREFTRDFANADDDAARDRLTSAHKQNKASVQAEYEEQQRLIAQGEAKNGKPQPQGSGAPQGTPPASAQPTNKPTRKVGDVIYVKGEAKRITAVRPGGKYDVVPAK